MRRSGLSITGCKARAPTMRPPAPRVEDDPGRCRPAWATTLRVTPPVVAGYGDRKDPNVALFAPWQKEGMRAFLEAARSQVDLARASVPVGAADPYAELERLAELRDRGIVTEEEFTANKRHLLGLD